MSAWSYHLIQAFKKKEKKKAQPSSFHRLVALTSGQASSLSGVGKQRACISCPRWKKAGQRVWSWSLLYQGFLTHAGFPLCRWGNHSESGLHLLLQWPVPAAAVLQTHKQIFFSHCGDARFVYSQPECRKCCLLCTKTRFIESHTSDSGLLCIRSLRKL